MSDRNKRQPLVQVVRRAAPGAPSTPKPTVTPTAAGTPGVEPRTVAPRPVHPEPRPAEPRSAEARPSEARTAEPRPPEPRSVETRSADIRPGTERPGASRSAGGPPRRAFPRSTGPRIPYTPEHVIALAQKERVPARIAKGELDGKMKCRIWKKLHPDDAKRFDQAYTLMAQNPSLSLDDAFGVAQSGMTVEEFQTRRARTKKRDEVKQARASVTPESIDQWVADQMANNRELSFILAERTVLDTLKAVQRTTFELERGGRLEKVNVVALMQRPSHDALWLGFPREPGLAQKPTPVSRQPSRRPVTDPRTFVAFVGQSLAIKLRNGVQVTQPLIAVGPFDVLVGSGEHVIFIPLHAMISWAPANSSERTTVSEDSPFR